MRRGPDDLELAIAPRGPENHEANHEADREAELRAAVERARSVADDLEVALVAPTLASSSGYRDAGRAARPTLRIVLRAGISGPEGVVPFLVALVSVPALFWAWGAAGLPTTGSLPAVTISFAGLAAFFVFALVSAPRRVLEIDAAALRVHPPRGMPWVRTIVVPLAELDRLHLERPHRSGLQLVATLTSQARRVLLHDVSRAAAVRDVPHLVALYRLWLEG